MNLITCPHCAVVLNADLLPFPGDIYDEEGMIDHDKAAWNGENYVPFVACPVCKNGVEKP